MKYHSKLTVAYSQIYLEDLTCRFHNHTVKWAEGEISAMASIGSNYIVIGTVSSIKAPIFIEVLEAEPILNLADWDHVNYCSFHINNGLVISGDFDTPEELISISLISGVYALFICYKDLDSVDLEGANSNDSYYVYVWPVNKPIPFQVLKQYKLRE